MPADEFCSSIGDIKYLISFIRLNILYIRLKTGFKGNNVMKILKIILVFAAIITICSCTGESAKKNTEGLLTDIIRVDPTDFDVAKSAERSFKISLNLVNNAVRTDPDGTQYQVKLFVMNKDNREHGAATLSENNVTLTKHSDETKEIKLKAGSENFEGKITFIGVRKGIEANQKAIITFRIR